MSTYRWKGSVERDAERQLVIKTTRDASRSKRLRLLHPYEPEFVVIESSGSTACWVATSNPDRREYCGRPKGPAYCQSGRPPTNDAAGATGTNTIGSTDTKTIPIVTSEKLFLMIGMLPKSRPAPRQSPTQPTAPIAL